jgi:hypothetical protein
LITLKTVLLASLIVMSLVVTQQAKAQTTNSSESWKHDPNWIKAYDNLMMRLMSVQCSQQSKMTHEDCMAKSVSLLQDYKKLQNIGTNDSK